MAPDSSYVDNDEEGSADVVVDDYDDYYFYPDDMRPKIGVQMIFTFC